MEDRVRFLEKLALEESLFWQLKLSADESITLRFGRHYGWQMQRRQGDVEERVATSAEAMRAQLEKWGVDPDTVNDQLTYAILSQTAYAAMFVEEAEQLLGEARVEVAVSSTRQFLKDLSTTVKKQTPNLKLVEEK